MIIYIINLFISHSIYSAIILIKHVKSTKYESYLCGYCSARSINHSREEGDPILNLVLFNRVVRLVSTNIHSSWGYLPHKPPYRIPDKLLVTISHARIYFNHLLWHDVNIIATVTCERVRVFSSWRARAEQCRPCDGGVGRVAHYGQLLNSRTSRKNYIVVSKVCTIKSIIIYWCNICDDFDVIVFIIVKKN